MLRECNNNAFSDSPVPGQLKQRQLIFLQRRASVIIFGESRTWGNVSDTAFKIWIPQLHEHRKYLCLGWSEICCFQVIAPAFSRLSCHYFPCIVKSHHICNCKHQIWLDMGIGHLYTQPNPHYCVKLGFDRELLASSRFHVVWFLLGCSGLADTEPKKNPLIRKEFPRMPKPRRIGPLWRVKWTLLLWR